MPWKFTSELWKTHNTLFWDKKGKDWLERKNPAKSRCSVPVQEPNPECTFFSTACLLTQGFQILALSLLITKPFIIQIAATPPWSPLLSGFNSQYPPLWVRALSWAEETHFSVPEYSANPTTSLSTYAWARQTLNPAGMSLLQEAISVQLLPQQQPQAHPVPRLSMEAE